MRALLLLTLAIAGCRSDASCDRSTCPNIERQYLSCAASDDDCFVVVGDTNIPCDHCACATAIARACEASPARDLAVPNDLTPPPDLAPPPPDWGSFTGTLPKIPANADAGAPMAPQWTNESDCSTDALLDEPNDSLPTATRLGDLLSTLTLARRAICPLGVKASTGRHDADVYALRLPVGKSGLHVTLTYDLFYGDLDLALLDSAGVIIAVDGSARNGGCLSAAVPPGTYYVVVVGAGDVDVNEYMISLEPQARSCP